MSEIYDSVIMAAQRATKTQLRQALVEASISLAAIGHPGTLSPPDAYICGHMARGSLKRVAERLAKP